MKNVISVIETVPALLINVIGKYRVIKDTQKMNKKIKIQLNFQHLAKHTFFRLLSHLLNSQFFNSKFFHAFRNIENNFFSSLYSYIMQLKIYLINNNHSCIQKTIICIMHQITSYHLNYKSSILLLNLTPIS